MRILFFATFFEYRGFETYYTSEINYFIKNYPDVEFIVYTIDCERNCTIRYNKNVLWIQRKKIKNVNTIILFLKDMVKIFTKFKPNIIHSVYVIESIIMGIVGKIFRTPCIFHSRGMDFNYTPFISFKRNILARIAGKLSNIIITVSKSMKNDGIKLNISQKKMITIYDGVDLTDLIPIKKEYYHPYRCFEILHIGRFSPEKCHDLIINTCKELKEKNVNYHLTLLGVGPLYEKIQYLVKELGLDNYISFIGWVNHNKIQDYMNKADIFILPSITEGLPISVLEAMSMNLPVILTNVGGMPELMQKNGGILIKKKSKAQLYNAIMFYVNNPKQLEIGSKINKDFILNNFNWNKHAKELYNVYLKLNKKKS